MRTSQKKIKHKRYDAFPVRLLLGRLESDVEIEVSKKQEQEQGSL